MGATETRKTAKLTFRLKQIFPECEESYRRRDTYSQTPDYPGPLGNMFLRLIRKKRKKTCKCNKCISLFTDSSRTDNN
jgi:hypothetical protein